MKILPIISFFIFLFFLILTPVSVYAQTPTNISEAPSKQDMLQAQTNDDVPQNLNTYTQSIVLELMGTTTCLLTGFNAVTNDTKCLGYDPQTKKLGYVENSGGAIGAMGTLIGMTYNIPISSTQYIAYLHNNFGITKPAYAQAGGIGFSSLGPLVRIWSEFRNITYLLFVLLFVLIGLGIMFRLQIDARTVMTIQNQIPKIIITLLLVTFSYAIAGLLVDLMWVSTYVSARVITNALPNGNTVYQESTNQLISFPHQFGDKALQDNGGLLGVGVTAGSGLGEIVQKLFTEQVSGKLNPDGTPNPCSGQPWWNISCWGNAVGDMWTLIKNALSAALGFVVSILAIVIIAAAIFAAMFRLWFSLIKAYVFILLNVALAPFYIMTGLLPGGIGFGGWVKDLLGNLAAFPATVIMFLLARVFIESFGANTTSDQFIPPLIGNPGATNALGGLIGMGIILITPDVVTITRDFFKSPQFNYISAVGTGVGAGRVIAGGFIGELASRAFYVNRSGEIAGPVGQLVYKMNGPISGKIAHAIRIMSRANTQTKP